MFHRPVYTKELFQQGRMQKLMNSQAASSAKDDVFIFMLVSRMGETVACRQYCLISCRFYRAHRFAFQAAGPSHTPLYGASRSAHFCQRPLFCAAACVRPRPSTHDLMSFSASIHGIDATMGVRNADVFMIVIFTKSLLMMRLLASYRL